MERILVIEDDESLARGIIYALEKEGWRVDAVRTVKEGYELWQKYGFALLLLDVMLPDGHGFELCEKIRRSSNVPIIFLTACDEEVNVVQGLDLGADDYITKPFRVRELISRIRAALRRTLGSQAVAQQIIRSGELTLYPLEQKVLKGDEELLLTPAEFKLLAVLMQNPLQTLNREQILEKLWDAQGKFVDDNTLSVYIRRLREKIEHDPAVPQYILTIRGFGYKWNQGSH